MSNRPLPNSVKPEKLLREQRVLQGVVSLEDEARLQGLVLASSGGMSVAVQAAKDEEGRLRLRGCLEASIEMQCQVCLEPVALQVSKDFDWLLVRGDSQAKAWWKEAEPVWIEDGEVAVREALIDELLLSLPIAPRHETQDGCNQQQLLTADNEREQRIDGEMQSPFADLRKMLKD